MYRGGNEMTKKRVFVTGTTGTMGGAAMKELLARPDRFDVVTLARDSEKNRIFMQEFANTPNLEVVWGDLTNYEDVLTCVTGCDYVIHCAAFVSPAADRYPKEAMAINYGGTLNLVRAVLAQPNHDNIKLVNIGTVAETGDRMAPIHWGRVGDPLKPSVHDYYAVSKIAAERAVIESGIKYWVSLRQTGIMSIKEFSHNEGIGFHQPLNNVLEWVTDHDSGLLCANACEDWVPEEFWGHVYNIGGGEDCRITNYELMSKMMAKVGIDDFRTVAEPNWYATHNFHGQWYLDSDKLDDFLNFRTQTVDDFIDYYGEIMQQAAGPDAAQVPLAAIQQGIREKNLEAALSDTGPLHWLIHNEEDKLEPFFISRKKWAEIPDWDQYVLYRPAGKPIILDHGYDENQPEAELSLDDVQKAAVFRGGRCLSTQMTTGDWRTKLSFECHCGHRFEASPRLILEAGHWCDTCERESWDFHNLAKHSPFFAQVWQPLHAEDELAKRYEKNVKDTDVL
jgi:nucleoside-diphosphate-sugar epimerase